MATCLASSRGGLKPDLEKRKRSLRYTRYQLPVLNCRQCLQPGATGVSQRNVEKVWASHCAYCQQRQDIGDVDCLCFAPKNSVVGIISDASVTPRRRRKKVAPM